MVKMVMVSTCCNAPLIMGVTGKEYCGDCLNRFNQELEDGEMVKIGVWVVCANDQDKIQENYVEVDTLLGATRFINAFKPKRGYYVVQFRVEEVGRLV